MKLSICIPTHNRCEYLFNSLKSICDQPRFSSTNDVEIIISDNASTDNTKSVADIYIKKFPNKVKYHKNIKNIEDSNFLNALKLGRGVFLKLANDTLIWERESLDYIINLIDISESLRPLLFFANNSIKMSDAIDYAHSPSEFLNQVSYYITWIGSFGIWKSDLQTYADLDRYAEKKLLQVGATLMQLRQKNYGIIVHKKCFGVQSIYAKGGYNLAEVFGRNYLHILREFSDIIDTNAYANAKKRVLLEHIIKYYSNQAHEFINQDILSYLEDYENEDYYQSDALPKILHQNPRNTPMMSNSTMDLKGLNNNWRKQNSHNHTYITRNCNLDRIKVGNYSYGPIHAWSWNAENEFLNIGNFVSIADDVKFILGGEHDYRNFSTYPFRVQFMGYQTEALSKGPINIKDDVWIGNSSIILSGVTIEQGAVIGAGSVVTKSIPPYAIVGGNPARILKYRFADEIIEKLLNIDYNRVDLGTLSKIQHLIYKSVNSAEFADEVLRQLPNR
jgi:acetyltransferase-like isoleucine patch superfamily enzyme